MLNLVLNRNSVLACNAGLSCGQSRTPARTVFIRDVGNNIIMTEHEKTNKLNKTDIISNLLWIAFGIIGGINYYSKKEYLIFGIMTLITILYAYKLFKSIKRK